MKTFKIALIILASMILFSCTKTAEVAVHGDQKAVFKVEVADSFARQAKGLMFRKNLEEDRGMLFIFDSPAARRFWMMNTSIPLDIIFIGEDKRIINIEEAEPCGLIPCKLYNSTGEALYVLEIRQGLSEKYGFKTGTEVEFDLG